MSSKAQHERIMKLNIKDKKLARLLFCAELTDRDSLFLNYAYEEKQHLHYRYAMALTCLGAVTTNYTLFRYNSTFTQFCSIVGMFLFSHLYWSIHVNLRFAKLSEPYFEKYSIK
eukprot:GHVR01102013.1.p1 GENE.GHVR01102013.1~~GHVR01102013.1.p1  ORF type:complete len:114 (+),score=0.45 GHVR01102013.1:1022-1363(+)